MNEYERLIAYMKILYHNLTTLHRNLVKDDAWFGNHKQIGKWYEEVSGEIDDLAETGIALGYKEPSISDAVLAFSNEVVATQPRRSEETYRMILEYFRRLAGMMQAAETIVPVSVQNKLQEYEYDWNKESNFKLAAALGERASDGRIEYDDD
jgi:DNA-binding ferritin-like protein